VVSSCHEHLWYFPYHFTFQLSFLLYFPYIFTIQPTFLPYYPYLITILFLILTCSCQYSYNLMLTSNCMCRPYIDTWIISIYIGSTHAIFHIFSLFNFLFFHIVHRRSWHGLTTPLFSNILFTNLFSITFLYFFIISSLFPYF
jgi:hypothetical protein